MRLSSRLLFPCYHCISFVLPCKHHDFTTLAPRLLPGIRLLRYDIYCLNPTVYYQSRYVRFVLYLLLYLFYVLLLKQAICLYYKRPRILLYHFQLLYLSQLFPCSVLILCYYFHAILSSPRQFPTAVLKAH